MTSIEEMIAAGEQLIETLDRAIAQERRFGFNLCGHMESINYSLLCAINDMKTIRYQMVHDGTGTEI